MTIYFTYRITNIITNQHYYGARWKPGCHPDDLWTSYFTSSKKVKNLINLYGKNSFIVQVRKTFNTREECRLWEQRVLTKLKVKTRKDWLNQAIGGLPASRKGYKHTPETIAKMKKPKKQRWTEERKNRKRQDELLKIAAGKIMPNTKGYKHTPETIAKMKLRVPWNKGIKKLTPAWNKGLKKAIKTDRNITKANSIYG